MHLRQKINNNSDQSQQDVLPRRKQEEYRMLEDMLEEIKKLGEGVEVELCGCSSNSNVKDYEISESRRQVLENIMEALIAPNTNMVGVCGKDDNHIDSLLQRVTRRGRRDNLFGMIVMVSIKENPDLRRIQEEIAHQIGCTFQGQMKQDKAAGYRGFKKFQFRRVDSKKFVIENAQQLSDKIRTVPNILFILRDVRSKLDWAKLGIPFGVDHQGCKLILTSESDDILLSNHMNTQCIFKF